jgi:hypothetical protein
MDMVGTFIGLGLAALFFLIMLASLSSRDSLERELHACRRERDILQRQRRELRVRMERIQEMLDRLEAQTTPEIARLRLGDDGELIEEA